MKSTVEERPLPNSSDATPVGSRRNPLGWIVFGAFLLQLAVWVGWLTLASKHKVAEVPLETRISR